MSTPDKIVIYGTELTDDQASVLRELVRDSLTDVERYECDSFPGSRTFARGCRDLYQLIKERPSAPFDPPEPPSYSSEGRMTIGRSR